MNEVASLTGPEAILYGFLILAVVGIAVAFGWLLGRDTPPPPTSRPTCLYCDEPAVGTFEEYNYQTGAVQCLWFCDDESHQATAFMIGAPESMREGGPSG